MSEWKKRTEIKYFVGKENLLSLHNDIQKFLPPDRNMPEIGYYFVNSIYFENENFQILKEKQDGISLRSKYRIRNYAEDLNDFFTQSPNNLEIKKRVSTNFVKGKTTINNNELQQTIDFKKLLIKKSDDSVYREFIAATKAKSLKPVLFVRYKRKAYLNEHLDIRATFDHDIVAGRVKTALPYKFHPVLQRDTCIFEIKYTNYKPYWLPDIVRKYNLKQEKISKFEAGIEKALNLY